MNARAVRPYSSSLRSEQAEQTRDRIVRAAVDLLSGADAGDLSMNEVAGRAGVSVRTVYRNFATREALLDGVVGWIGDQLGRRVGPPPSTSSEYVEATPKVIAALFEIEPLYRALFATTTGRESHRRTKGARLDDIQARVRDRDRVDGRGPGQAVRRRHAPRVVVERGAVHEGLLGAGRRRDRPGPAVGDPHAGRRRGDPKRRRGL